MNAEVIPHSVDDPRVKPVAERVDSLVESVDTFAVANADDYAAGAEVLKTIKGLASDVEAQRKKITAPLDQAKKEVMDLFRPFTNALTDAEGKIKRRLIGWKSEQDRIAREEQRKADERARKERERLEVQARAAAEAGRAERAETLRQRAEVVVSAPPTTVAPKVSGISERTAWKFEIVDASKVPDKYKTIDEKKIGGVVRALKGDTDIPGIRVYEEAVLGARRA